MGLASIIAIIVCVLIASFVIAFGKVIGAGGNVSDFSSDSKTKSDNIEKKSCTSQAYRTIAGIIFGILLLSPVAWVTTHNGPLIRIDPRTRLIVVIVLIVVEIILLLIINDKDTNS